MKTLLAIPCMDMVPVEFASSLARLNKVGEVGLQINKGSLIYESRNKLSADAIRQGVDYVMWFDSDMVFPPDTLEKMLKHMETYDIVTGVYFRRCGSYKPVIFKTLDFEGEKCVFEDYDHYPHGALFEVAAAGFGCICMKADVLYDILGKFGTAFTPIGNTGEDIAFCWRARQLGYKIMADPTINLGHVGYQVITRDFFEAYEEMSNNEQHG